MTREKIRQAATLELENDKEKKMRHEVIAGVIRIQCSKLYSALCIIILAA
jgi:hypothetical protein